MSVEQASAIRALRLTAHSETTKTVHERSFRRERLGPVDQGVEHTRTGPKFEGRTRRPAARGRRRRPCHVE